MKLSADDKKIQADIASRLKLGLPLAGLLTMLTVGCDKIPGFHTMGKTPSRHHQVMGDVPNIVPEEETPKVDNRNNETTPKPSDNNTETLPLAGKPLPPKEDNNDNEMKKGTKTPPPLMGVPLPPKSDMDNTNEKATEKN